MALLSYGVFRRYSESWDHGNHMTTVEENGSGEDSVETMPSVLVTGATGMVGTAVAQELLDNGYTVRALARPGSDTTALEMDGIPLFIGDINDGDAVAAAVSGVDYVCHVAGLVPGSTRDSSEFHDVNVKGTRTVRDASVAAGVRRILHVSTVHTFGKRPGSVIDELSDLEIDPHLGYDSSKISAEEIMLETDSGTEVVVVNPTVIFGPRSSHAGRILQMFVKGRLPVTPLPDRSLSLVYVADVARGVRLALEEGRTGQRYILASEAISTRNFIQTLANVTGRKPPRFSVPTWLVQAVVSFFWLVSPITRWRPPITPAGIREGGTVYDGSKATRELGLEYTDLGVALRETVEHLDR